MQLGGLLVSNVSFEVASSVDFYIHNHTPYDGTLGLSSRPDANASTAMLGQLQSSLDLPVFTIRPNYDDSTGQVALGGFASDQCQGDSWTQVESEPPICHLANLLFGSDCTMPVFKLTGVSTTVAGCQEACILCTPLQLLIRTRVRCIYTSARCWHSSLGRSNLGSLGRQ
jgi:Eukaryotic aspartyl protease